jgi:hypothetical protein
VVFDDHSEAGEVVAEFVRAREPRHDDVPHLQVIRKPGAPDWVP